MSRKPEIRELALSGLANIDIAEALGVSPDHVRKVKREFGIPTALVLSKPRVTRLMLPLFETAKKRVSYDASTGDFYSSRGAKIGFLKNGYVAVYLKPRTVMAHRLAWLLHYQSEPPEIIDHIDGDPTNNRISNLREATVGQNSANKKRHRNNSVGVKGVSRAGPGTYRVRVKSGAVSLTCFVPDLESARKARQRLAEQLHGEFARHD